MLAKPPLVLLSGPGVAPLARPESAILHVLVATADPATSIWCKARRRDQIRDMRNGLWGEPSATSEAFGRYACSTFGVHPDSIEHGLQPVEALMWAEARR